MYYKRATYDNLSWGVVLKVCNIFAHNQRAGACLRDAAAEFEFLPRWKIFATQPSGVWISDVGWHLPPPFHVPMWKKLKQLSHWFGIDHFIYFLFHLCPNQVCLRIHCFVCTIYNCTWLPQAVYPVQVLVQKETLYVVALWIWCVLPCNWEDSLAAGVRYFHREPRERERERAARAYNVAALGRYTSHSITTQPSIWPRYHILILNCLKIILWDKSKSIPPLGGNTCYTWKKNFFL